MPILPTRTDLVYNIVEETLTGAIDGVAITARAGAGGRAGSKRAGAVNPLLANNPYATGVKKTANNPGGPLPHARYTMKTHEKRAFWIRLIPVTDDAYLLGARSGFAIHGRGQWGSDGCIVPGDFTVVKLLYELVKARETAGKPSPTVEVVSIGDFARFDRLNRTA